MTESPRPGFSAEDSIRMTRNAGIRETVRHLRDGNRQRAYLTLFESFRTQARLSGIGWDYGVNPVTKR